VFFLLPLDLLKIECSSLERKKRKEVGPPLYNLERCWPSSLHALLTTPSCAGCISCRCVIAQEIRPTLLLVFSSPVLSHPQTGRCNEDGGNLVERRPDIHERRLSSGDETQFLTAVGSRNSRMKCELNRHSGFRMVPRQGSCIQFFDRFTVNPVVTSTAAHVSPVT
jgi:hypothetical protein